MDAVPAAAVLMSAWTDLMASGESYQSRAVTDAIHQRPMIVAMARNYLGARGDLLASPLFAGKACAIGVGVELEVWDHMLHAFRKFPRKLEEVRQAIRHIGRFLQTRLFEDTPVSPPITRGP